MSYNTDLGILQSFDEYYNEAYYAWDPLFPEAEKDLRFYLGDQWDENEKKALFQEGRNTFVFNRIRPVINLISGYQRKNRLSSVVSPVENGDQKTADQLSQLLLYTLQAANGYQLISDCFDGAIKTGWNLASIYMDYRQDPVNGDIKFAREPWNGFIIDPYFTQMDFSDASYLMRRKYLGVDMVASMLPGQEDEVHALHRIGWERDDKFTWLPYQRQPNGQDLMAYNEFYMQRWESQDVIVDMETGEYRDWTGDREMFARLKELNPAFDLVQRQKRVIDMHIIVNDHVMRTTQNPYGLNEYPFVPFMAIWEPESDQWGLKIQSLIRCMRDPQREANRRRSQMIDVLDSQINSGWIADEGSVINPRSLFQASQGKVIWRNKDSQPGSVERLQPAQIPQGMFQLQQQFDADLKEIAGVNDAAFGVPDSGNESGVMTMLRQGAALTNLQTVFDNLRFSQKLLSQKALKLIQTWTPQKIQRILNEEPTEAFYTHDFTKYDCSIQEGVLTDSQRQIYFRQLLDLQQVGAPVTGLMLAKAAPLQGKSEFLEEMEQMQQQQQQAAQKQEEMQAQLMQAQMELAKTQSLNQLGSAKERETRAVANMGLEDERASEAVQNRNQAVLDQARAAKELQEIDLRQLKEYLTLTEMISQKHRSEEEQMKQEDVRISEQAIGMPAVAQQQGGENAQI